SRWSVLVLKHNSNSRISQINHQFTSQTHFTQQSLRSQLNTKTSHLHSNCLGEVIRRQ
ncbi:hypothetical protein LINPERPRIM_LOCUS41380, partial [Linum perenne]